MKTAKKLLTLFILISVIPFVYPEKTSAQTSVSFQVFYDNLSPYGTWIHNSTYGYVWIPNVGPHFTPYSTGGNWFWTKFGWTWVSDYPWGWAPFHYGRWYTDPYYGAIWVPGNEWGPGWVTWRRCDGYYGWAPIEPGVNLGIAYTNKYVIPDDRWIFVRERDFGKREIDTYAVKTNKGSIVKKSVVIYNVREDSLSKVIFNAGPDRMEVQKSSRRIFEPVVVKEANKAGQNLRNNILVIYRPPFENSTVGKPAPKKVADLKKIKRIPKSPEQVKIIK